MSGQATGSASRTRIRVATGIWFGVLMVSLLCTDLIAQLDTSLISMIVVLASTALFTSMQVIAREMAASRDTGRRAGDTPPKRSIGDLALRNLIVVASIYAILWSLGALPF